MSPFWAIPPVPESEWVGMGVGGVTSLWEKEA